MKVIKTFFIYIKNVLIKNYFLTTFILIHYYAFMSIFFIRFF